MAAELNDGCPFEAKADSCCDRTARGGDVGSLGSQSLAMEWSLLGQAGRCIVLRTQLGGQVGTCESSEGGLPAHTLLREKKLRFFTELGELKGGRPEGKAVVP